MAKKIRTVKDLCEAYINSRETKVKCSTHSTYCDKLRRHIAPRIGAISYDKLTPVQVEKFYMDMLSEGLAPTTVCDTGIFLRSAYKWAGKVYGCPNIPAQAELPRKRKRMVTVLTAREKRAVMEQGGPAEKIALTIGLRIGEVCGLMGQDLEDGVLTVRRTVQRVHLPQGSTRILVTEPKTRNSVREIPVPKSILPLLKVPPDCYVLTGKPFPPEPRTVENHWKRSCEKMGIKNANFHKLRHTFATSALEAGVDVKTLSEILGHASVNTTMDLYCHPTLDHKKKCMKKIWKESP